MDVFRRPLRAAGRVALAAMFITGGADAMLAPGPRTDKAAELGVPFCKNVSLFGGALLVRSEAPRRRR